MSAIMSLHKASSVAALHVGEVSWLHVEADDGSYVSVFMPFHVAVAMAQAYTAATEASKPAQVTA